MTVQLNMRRSSDERNRHASVQTADATKRDPGSPLLENKLSVMLTILYV